ncbi:ABC transporter permease subunit [bacterium]|nr:ABC transporter permease subunit [bacterium]
MTGAIIKREVLEYFKSSRFLIGLVFTVGLVVISTLVNIGDYRQRQQDYLSAGEHAERSFQVEIFRAPLVLSTLAQGMDKKLGSRIEFTYYNLPEKTSGYMGFASQSDVRFFDFTSIDFAFTVRVVLSLIVIFLAYNAIAEEKEQGTLKLALSNSVPRDKVLLGKFFGGMIVIFAAVTVSLLCATLILMIHPAVPVTAGLLGRIALMYGVSLLYLIAFYTMTLFVSTVVRRSATALMILLQVWIFLIVIVPNLGVILSKKIMTLPSAEEIRQEEQSVFEPYREEYERIRTEYYSMHGNEERYRELGRKNFELAAQKTELEYQVRKRFADKLSRQVRLARDLSLISPAVLFDAAMTRFAGTDIIEYERFMDGVERAYSRYREVRELLYTDRNRYREEMNNQEPFTYASPSVGESVSAMLPQLLILFLFSVVFFVLGFVTFLRKDIR